MSGALDFWVVLGICPEALVGDRVGVGGGDSRGKAVVRIGGCVKNEALNRTYHHRVFFQIGHFAYLPPRLFVWQGLFVDHGLLFRDDFWQRHL